jgi:branched-chain amino acid aminotransferase
LIHQLNFNGELFPTEEKLFGATNRAFRYGDGLFETIRMINGRLPLLPFHFRRLHKSAALLSMELPSVLYSLPELTREIKKVSGTHSDCRIRLTCFRKEGGLYTPKQHKASFVLEASLLPPGGYAVDPKGKVAGIHPDLFLAQSPISGLKTTNSLPYVLAGIYAKEQHWDACLLRNEKTGLAEAHFANLLCWNGQEWHSPAPSTEGCIEGVMLQYLEEKMTILRKHIPLNEVVHYPTICFINAVQGIQWIRQLNGQQLKPGPIDQINTLLP